MTAPQAAGELERQRAPRLGGLSQFRGRSQPSMNGARRGSSSLAWPTQLPSSFSELSCHAPPGTLGAHRTCHYRPFLCCAWPNRILTISITLSLPLILIVTLSTRPLLAVYDSPNSNKALHTRCPCMDHAGAPAWITLGPPHGSLRSPHGMHRSPHGMHRTSHGMVLLPASCALAGGT